MAEESVATPDPAPDELRNPKLGRALRGYDTAAVDVLLARVADSVQALAAERDDLRARIAKLEEAAGETEDSQRLLRDALVSAQRAAEDLKRRTQEECDELLDRAKAEAREIDEHTRLERERAEAELDRLRTQERELRASYRVLLAAALERLEERVDETEAPTPSLLDALAPRRVTAPANERAERS